MKMRKHTLTAAVAAGLAALSIGLAAPAIAAPSGPSDDTVGTAQTGSNANANAWWTNSGMTPYGTYQNEHGHQAGSRR